MSLLKLCVIADTHYYDATLGVSGEAYRLRSASDQKCLAETDAVISAAFQKITESDCDAVLLAGDLTNDGERICHEKMREKLYVLQRHKRVFVTTATHDWCTAIRADLQGNVYIRMWKPYRTKNCMPFMTISALPRRAINLLRISARLLILRICRRMLFYSCSTMTKTAREKQGISRTICNGF